MQNEAKHNTTQQNITYIIIAYSTQYILCKVKKANCLNTRFLCISGHPLQALLRPPQRQIRTRSTGTQHKGKKAVRT